VAWIFETKGYIEVESDKISEEDLFSIVIDAGAEDLRTEETTYEITMEPGQLELVKKALDEKKIPMAQHTITKLPKNTIEVKEPSQAKAILRLMEELEDHEDVQNVYANFDIPDQILEELGKEA